MTSGDWIVFAPDEHYNGSDGARRPSGGRVDGEVVPPRGLKPIYAAGTR